MVGFTLAITDSGQTPYTGVAVTDSLAELADDGVYDGDATASAGTVWVRGRGADVDREPDAGGRRSTVTFSVTVDNPDAGDKLLIVSAASSAAGSSCPPGTITAPCQVTVPVLTPGLTIVKTASAATAVPGQVVTYTVTVTDSGQTAYAGAVVADDLSGVVDDAAYDGDATATAGSVSYAAPVLTWTGGLSPGGSATITYSVTVDNPDTGDTVLTNTVTSPTAGSNCPAGERRRPLLGHRRARRHRHPHLRPELGCDLGHGRIYGALHGHGRQLGPEHVPGATFTDPLTGILGDASYDGDAAVSSGTVTYAAPDLTWTGDLLAGTTATITFSVTVNSPDTGGHILASTLSSSSPDGNCGPTSADPRCSVTVTVSQLTIDSAFSPATVTPGGTLVETTTIDNTGQTPYLGISVDFATANTTAQISDAGDETASSGTLSVGATGAVWTGDVPVGATVTITGGVSVASPYPAGGQVIAITDATTAPGSNCPAGCADPRCTATGTVQIPGLTITNTSSATAVVPGSVGRVHPGDHRLRADPLHGHHGDRGPVGA